MSEPGIQLGSDHPFQPATAPCVFSSESEPLSHPDSFVRRHIGPSAEEAQQMLQELGLEDLDALISATIPEKIRTQRPLELPPPRTEFEVLRDLRRIASQNKVYRSYLGMGYHDCITPPVIQRNILENPGWYTQYTPYQAEIAQGRLEALLNFQTMIMDLTGLEIANASLLDEATAAAEAMHMCFGLAKNDANKFFVSTGCHPQTIDVVRTRAKPLGIEVVVGDHEQIEFSENYFAVLVQYPTTLGTIHDYSGLVVKAHTAGAMVIVAADILSLTLLRPPGEFGADVAIGSTQRFGVPLGYGGPHAAYFATRDAFKRQMPGRLVGVSKDSSGRPAYRLSLQTREQHIRREKATSNICTAQVLLAVIASMYAVYHGPQGLRRIAERVRHLTGILATGLKRLGFRVGPEDFFDTITVHLDDESVAPLIQRAEQREINLRVINERTIGISLDESVTEHDLADLWNVFHGGKAAPFSPRDLFEESLAALPELHTRATPFLTHPVFNKHHSETEMLRYLRKLEARDLSLAFSMIPLGSCTMKLNATAEMFPVTWPEFGRIHPFVPLSQTRGYQTLFKQLEAWLAEITGFDAVSLQPNAGSQGEYAGLLAIHEYHEHRGQTQRRVCLIPTSAHGTNPASAVMAGLQVVPVACDLDGNIDVNDLRAKAAAHKDNLAALMVTYPSTHGVFEESIKEICQIVHEHGGLVYMDGANMNAQVGLCRPAELGADVCHLNLHKTFCIPHGGGGPGMGPIGVVKALAPFLPRHPVVPLEGEQNLGAVAAAPWGSASILPISWVYIALMGPRGLTEATQVAILNANYIAHRLSPYFPVLYKGKNGLVAHECILDVRQFKSIAVEDIAKRLMDYGFHAPTISFPVPGTMMVEPTESESKEELDRFCEALISIHAEIVAIETGRADRQNNLLKNAPHTAEALLSEKWERPYPREQAAYPTRWLRDHKFWPAVGRIDNVYGDRNLVCSCIGMDAFLDAQ
ncbi:MAG: aminomethyl-transferring glycine dehydrogenase [Verrucomicrobiota bacterium]